MDNLTLFNPQSPDLQGPTLQTLPVGRISGKAHFPKSWLQAAPGEVVSFATVSLIDPLDGKTLSGGRTDSAGNFSLAPDGSLSLPLDGYYYLEVSKRLNGAAIGSSVVSMRTVLKWTASGWASITNASGGAGDIVVNPTTTAVVLLDHEDVTIGFSSLIGKVSGAPGYTSVATIGSHAPAAIAARATEVSNLLASDQDPLGGLGGSGPLVQGGGNLAPGDNGDPSVHHDFLVKKGSVDNYFVWIPRFTAYQLVLGQGGKPAGYWVKDRPTGVEGTDWVQEDFGGFYAAKYEASRSDATSGAVGTSTTLKVAKAVVPWHSINWDAAVAACRDFDPYAYLMSDEEWTALAVWSMIQNTTVYGNNSSGKDTDVNATTFTADPTQSGRALTGTGTNANWSGGVNLTTHTGKTDGVYDLNGNVMEWTSSLEFKSDGNYYADEVKLAVNGPTTSGYVKTLSTHSALRRYGIPALVTAQEPFFGKDYFSISSSNNFKAIRGGYWTYTTHAGVWSLTLNNARSYSLTTLGFRPVLRY
jgi:formylglycine-generating enzyme required for sulfatase activity